MSVVVVQVGQCGNQLGEVLWSRLKLAVNGSPSPFFCPSDGKARCVLVDAEPKVVSAVVERSPSIFRPDGAVVGQSGMGNNWGAGYHGLCGSRGSPSRPSRATDSASAAEARLNAAGRSPPGDTRHAFRVQRNQREDDELLLPRVLCAVHNEGLRIADGHWEAIVVLHSLAGGTGSGFTSRLVEKLREHFTHHAAEDELDAATAQRRDRQREEDGLGGIYGEQRKAIHLISVAVAPSVKGGGTTVQGINTTLTLRSLFRATDAIVLLRNDEAAAVGCQSHAQFNAFFVDALLLPMLEYGRTFGALGRLIVHCAPDPRMKLLTAVPLPQRNFAKLRRCASLSYCIVPAAPRQGASATEGLDVRSLHTPQSAPHLAFLSQQRAVDIPKHFQATPPSSYFTGAALILNQVEEVNRSLLFPLVRDCKLKCDANAFMHRFSDAGVTPDIVRDCIRDVAHVLSEEPFS